MVKTWRDVPGETPPQDCELLIELVSSLPEGCTVVELGTNQGSAGLAMASVCKGKVYMVDDFRQDHAGWVQPSREKVEAHIEALGMQERCQIVEGDSAQVGRDWKGSSVDLLYVDAGHDYESVKADLEAWLPHVKGWIVLHDFNNLHVPGVERAGLEALGQPERRHWLCGVWRV